MKYNKYIEILYLNTLSTKPNNTFNWSNRIQSIRIILHNGISVIFLQPFTYFSMFVYVNVSAFKCITII